MEKDNITTVLEVISGCSELRDEDFLVHESSPEPFMKDLVRVEHLASNTIIDLPDTWVEDRKEAEIIDLIKKALGK